MQNSPENTSDIKASKPLRRHDLDWIRVLATFGVIIFHTMRMFDPDDWEVKNNITSDLVMIFIFFWAQWMMPIFFTISGASTYYALGFRSPMQFLKARTVRIMVPLLTVGIFVLSPPQDFIKQVTHGIIPPDFPIMEFLSNYVTQNRPFLGFPYFGYPIYHLWYLYFLFVFSLVLLPIFVYLRSESGTALIARFSKFFNRSWTIYLWIIPICIITTLLDPTSELGNLNYYGGWSMLVYPFIFIMGFLLVSHERFEKAVYSQGKIALVLSIITYIGLMIMFIVMGDEIFGTYGTPTYALLMSLRAFSMWCFMIAILYLGKRYFSYDSPRLQYFSEGSLPYYMLHQTIIVIIGYQIAQWQIGILPKWIFLVITTFIGIMVIYEYGIRRFNPIRFLFGVKPLKK
ncbi:MAG: acyltransferase family protein [Nitrospirae bacterium]|nr:acyltransferase family protein [Nitrospirota bacterium]